LNQNVASYTYKTARRIVVAIVGGTVLLVGIAMIVLPGPATLVIPAGLAILALEFAWARRWLRRIKVQARQTIRRLNHGRNSPRTTASPARQNIKP
jgi:tellurite resistance protein TerC